MDSGVDGEGVGRGRERMRGEGGGGGLAPACARAVRPLKQFSASGQGGGQVISVTDSDPLEQKWLRMTW
jgi:hypothetical protein